MKHCRHTTTHTHTHTHAIPEPQDHPTVSTSFHPSTQAIEALALPEPAKEEEDTKEEKKESKQQQAANEDEEEGGMGEREMEEEQEQKEGKVPNTMRAEEEGGGGSDDEDREAEKDDDASRMDDDDVSGNISENKTKQQLQQKQRQTGIDHQMKKKENASSAKRRRFRPQFRELDHPGYVELRVSLPGVAEKDFDVTVDNDKRSVTITGVKKNTRRVPRQRSFGQKMFSLFGAEEDEPMAKESEEGQSAGEWFEESFQVPANLRLDQAKADFESGQLSIFLPKKRRPQPQRHHYGLPRSYPFGYGRGPASMAMDADNFRARSPYGPENFGGFGGFW
mmetsp:Transcript_30964/g.59772  ORF Transcript_30964/g.59772 Transcript_30964/m.59772 type:complete len:336 (-) Transcript_30964:247-1254(-)